MIASAPKSPTLWPVVQRAIFQIGNRRKDGVATEKDVADKLGIKAQRLNDYLTGRVPMSDKMIAKLCGYVRIPAAKTLTLTLAYHRERIEAQGDLPAYYRLRADRAASAVRLDDSQMARWMAEETAADALLDRAEDPEVEDEDR